MTRDWTEPEIRVVLGRMLARDDFNSQLSFPECRALALTLGRDLKAVRRKSWDVFRVWRGDDTNKGGRETTRLALEAYPLPGARVGSVRAMNAARTPTERAAVRGPAEVYAITGQRSPVGDHKIGVTTDSKGRLAQARTWIAGARFVARVQVPAGLEAEAAAHAFFSDRNLGLEHFHSLDPDEIRACFSTLGKLCE